MPNPTEMLKATMLSHKRNVNRDMFPLLLDYHQRELKSKAPLKTFFLYFMDECIEDGTIRFWYVEDSHKVWGMREAELMRQQDYKEYKNPTDATA